MKCGDRFEHARQIDGSPKAGTARPVVMELTRVSDLSFWYRRADNLGAPASWVAERSKADTVVGKWL
jgi:hypothetical protein